jgi:hypothetical protein
MISSQTSHNEHKQNRFLKVHPFRKLECKITNLNLPLSPGPICWDVTNGEGSGSGGTPWCSMA